MQKKEVKEMVKKEEEDEGTIGGGNPQKQSGSFSGLIWAPLSASGGFEGREGRKEDQGRGKIKQEGRENQSGEEKGEVVGMDKDRE